MYLTAKPTSRALRAKFFFQSAFVFLRNGTKLAGRKFPSDHKFFLPDTKHFLIL
jgi:hypothetical protein